MALDQAVSAWGDAVQSLSGGDAAKIASSGFDVASEGRAPIALTAPDEISATAGDDVGEVDLACDPVRGARSYEVQATTDVTGAAGWSTAAIRSRSGEPGPWSITVQKMAP